MQFVVIGLDGTDDKALARRQKARPAHIALGEKLRQAGNMWYGAALLHEDGTMKGSLLVVDFASETELQKWLEAEPYVTENIWQEITIHKSNTSEPWQFNRSKEWFESRQDQ